MKTGIHILLIALFLTQAFSTTLILVNFSLNRKEIAQTLCVKKSEPKNCCQGSCHLKKQLDAEEKKEQAPSGSIKTFKEVQLFCHKNTRFDFTPYVLIDKAFTHFQITKTKSFSLSIFHPPCLSCNLTV